MKKIIILLMFSVFAIFFNSCKCFNSKPINPHVVGSTNLQYDSEIRMYYALIDSVKYPIHTVAIPDNNLGHRPSNVQPVKGMYVTVFTSHYYGFMAIAGKLTEAQIEEAYENYMFNSTVIFLAGLIIILLLILIVPNIISSFRKEHY